MLYYYTEDEYDIIPLSTYTDVNTLAERMSANNSTLSVLSLNAQSINMLSSTS